MFGEKDKLRVRIASIWLVTVLLVATSVKANVITYNLCNYPNNQVYQGHPLTLTGSITIDSGKTTLGATGTTLPCTDITNFNATLTDYQGNILSTGSGSWNYNAGNITVTTSQIYLTTGETLDLGTINGYTDTGFAMTEYYYHPSSTTAGFYSSASYDVDENTDTYSNSTDWYNITGSVSSTYYLQTHSTILFGLGHPSSPGVSIGNPEIVATAVPEPASLTLLISALLGLVGAFCLRRRAKA